MLSSAKTSGKLWTRSSRNYILKTVVKISRVPLDRFFWSLQGLCKKKLSSESRDELFERKNLFFYLQKINEKWGQNFQKKFKLAICQNKKKYLLAHCFDSFKTIISHLFWFKSDVLDNILTAARGLAENGLPVKTT